MEILIPRRAATTLSRVDSNSVLEFQNLKIIFFKFLKPSSGDLNCNYGTIQPKGQPYPVWLWIQP
jgi:hypothetical protein